MQDLREPMRHPAGWYADATVSQRFYLIVGLAGLEHWRQPVPLRAEG